MAEIARWKNGDGNEWWIRIIQRQHVRRERELRNIEFLVPGLTEKPTATLALKELDGRARFFDAEVEEGQVDALGTDAAVFKCFNAIVVPDR
jgi:hypothetical protein